MRFRGVTDPLGLALRGSGSKKSRSYTKKGPGRMPYNKGKPKKGVQGE